MQAVTGWVDGFTREATGASHQYRANSDTVTAGGVDSSSLAWLNFHACRENGFVNVSVELVDWNDKTEEYVCIWRDAGSLYVIDGNALVLSRTFLCGIGAWITGSTRSTTGLIHDRPLRHSARRSQPGVPGDRRNHRLETGSEAGLGPRWHGPLHPQGGTVCRAARDRSIRAEFDGRNHRELARKYSLTVVWIRTIVGQDLDRPVSIDIVDKQIPLF